MRFFFGLNLVAEGGYSFSGVIASDDMVRWFEK